MEHTADDKLLTHHDLKRMGVLVPLNRGQKATYAMAPDGTVTCIRGNKSFRQKMQWLGGHWRTIAHWASEGPDVGWKPAGKSAFERLKDAKAILGPGNRTTYLYPGDPGYDTVVGVSEKS